MGESAWTVNFAPAMRVAISTLMRSMSATLMRGNMNQSPEPGTNSWPK